MGRFVFGVVCVGGVVGFEGLAVGFAFGEGALAA